MPLVGLLGVVIVAVGLRLPAEATAALPAEPAAPAADNSERPDAVSAMVTARVTGERVEDLSQRTESSVVFANPDGTWTSEATTEPERVVDEEGEWHEVDTTLLETEGGLSPAHAASDLRLSVGGDRVFASISQEEGPRLEFRWPTVLPEPVVDGATATYPDALPGVGDLVVVATTTGFGHNIVINEAPTVPAEVTIPVATGGADLLENPTGELVVESGDGESVIAAARPLMWDSSTDAGGEPAVEPVQAEIGETASGMPTLTLAADKAFLTDPDTVYPVTMDPAFTINPSVDTWVQNADFTSSQTLSEELRAGTYDGGAHKARSFLRFANGDAAWDGKHILDATLTLRNFYSRSCTGAAIRASRITEDWTATNMTWANQPSVGALYDEYSPAKGFNSDCPDGPASWTMTEIVDGWAHGQPNHGIRLAAANETNNNSWRKYHSDNYTNASARPRLSVTYNTYPNKAGTPTVSPGDTGYTTTNRPTFKTKVSDPDGGTVRAKFEIYQGSSLQGAAWTDYVTSGGTAELTWPAALGSSTYTVKALTNDGTDSALIDSASTTFTVDTVKPDTTITATGFIDGEWATEAPESNTFNFDGPNDTKSFSYSLDGVAQPAKEADASGDAVLQWVAQDGAHVVRVSARDRAGNVGATAEFAFGVGAPGFSSPDAAQRGVSTFPVTIAGPPEATDIALSWRLSGSTTWQPAEHVELPEGSAWDGIPIPSQAEDASSSGDLVWNAAEEIDPATDAPIEAPALIDIRACFSYPSSAIMCSGSRQVQLVSPGGDANAPTTEVGPVTVDLGSGEASLSTSDSADSMAGIARTFQAYSRATITDGPFGKGWIASVPTIDGGVGSSVLVDNTDGDGTNDGTFVLIFPGGGSQTFARDPNAPDVYLPVGQDDGSRLSVSGAAPSREVVYSAHGSTTVTWSEGAEGWELLKTNPAGQNDGITFSHSGNSHWVTWIAQVAPGTSPTCTAVQQDEGCRGLRLTYDASGHVTAVDRLAYGLPEKRLASYTYESGLLVEACDQRSAPVLCTSYGYTEVAQRTLLETFGPPGVTPWRLEYDADGRLVQVHRQRVDSSSDATWTVAYDLEPLSPALPDMQESQVAEWGQDAVPTAVYAVWGPNREPASAPSEEDLRYATLWWTDASGRVTNSGSYGAGDWQVDATWYDAYGNTVQYLPAEGRTLAIAAPDGSGPAAAQAASDLTVYNAHGTRVEHVYSAATTSTLPSGETGAFRTHTSFTYDDENPGIAVGRPSLPEDQDSFNLVVEQTTSFVNADLSSPRDPRTTRFEYSPNVVGDGNGWDFEQPTRTLTRKDDGSWSTAVTRLDARGREIESRQPGGLADSNGAGSDAHSTRTVYYGEDAADADCRGHAEWSGLVCKVGPAAQPGVSPAIPTRWFSEYDDELRPVRTEEHSGSEVRVTTNAYDSLGRPTATTVSDGHDTRHENIAYDPSNGLPISQSGNGKSTHTEYDGWGRVAKYTDATGWVSTTTYTADSLPATFNDGSGTYAYLYDSETERRRLPTKVSVSDETGVGAYDVTYNAAAQISSMRYPNGTSASFTYDEAGIPTTSVFEDQTGNPLLAFGNTVDPEGKVLSSTSVGSTRDYTYDSMNRLTSTEERNIEGCTTREYEYGVSMARSSFKLYAPEPGSGSCQTVSPTLSRAYTVDAANRIIDPGFTYDNFGRTLTTPAADTGPVGTQTGTPGPLHTTYYANDRLKSARQDFLSAGTTTTLKTEYELDPSARVSAVVSTVSGDESERLRYHYSDRGDSPSSIETSTDGGQSWQGTRYVSIPGFGMVASTTDGVTEYVLCNLQGHAVATQAAESGSAVTSYVETDEFGNRAPGGVHGPRYVWHGAQQRSTDSQGGLVLMGARAYNPATGTFLTADPIPQGNETTYSYPSDPINRSDLTGLDSKGGPMYRACRNYASVGTCTYVMAYLGVINSMTADMGWKDDASNAARHFAFMVWVCYKVSCAAAKAMGDAHERGAPDKADSRRDQANNAYSRGWYGRHSKFAASFFGLLVDNSDFWDLLWHGRSLWRRAYLYSLCGPRQKKVTRGPCGSYGL
jgi:RHS repeat-associated protein